MKNRNLMDLFEENELNVASLYSIYAKKIPQEYEFWNNLSNEEISHAESIKNEKEITLTIIENKFSRGVVNYIMNYVLKEIKRATEEKITHIEALRTALRIERSMLEKKCFDMFIPTNKTVKNILTRLNDETEQHVEILMKEMKKNKFTFE